MIFGCRVACMMNLIEDVSALSDGELLTYSVKLVRHEDDIGLRIIECLREAEKRMLFCQVGAGSLWDYATKYLGLSNGNAQMKIDAMRLARDNSIAKEKIETGDLSIVNAAKVNSFFRQERKAGHVYTPEEKAQVIESVLGLSQSKCERTLLSLAPEALLVEKIRPLTETKTEIKMIVDEKTMAVLERLKELLSTKMPHATYAELLDYLAREKVELLERKLMGATMKELKGQAQDSTTPTGVAETVASLDVTKADFSSTARKYISVHDRRWVMSRAKSQCEYVSPDGHRCSSKWNLAIDHIVPLASGGGNDRTNYRAACKLCRIRHNLHYADLRIMPTWANSVAISCRN